VHAVAVALPVLPDRLERISQIVVAMHEHDDRQPGGGVRARRDVEIEGRVQAVDLPVGDVTGDLDGLHAGQAVVELVERRGSTVLDGCRPDRRVGRRAGLGARRRDARGAGRDAGP